jgi:hypothetical protein
VSPAESLAFGLVKRLVLLVRILGFAAEWTGLWGMLDDLFCAQGSDDDCQPRSAHQNGWR